MARNRAPPTLLAQRYRAQWGATYLLMQRYGVQWGATYLLVQRHRAPGSSAGGRGENDV